MKNKIYTKWIILVVTLSWLYSCESYTEIDTPQSQLTTAAAFENVKTADAAMSDIYARLREESLVAGTLGGLSSLMGNYADEMQYTGSNIDIAQFHNHTIVSSNGLIISFWNATYSEIYAANLMLEGLKKSLTINTQDRNRLSGEALFIRAYLHFYLVNLFGDIPYVTTTDHTINTTIAKGSQQELWQNIIADLTKAESLLPIKYSSVERVTINKAVATAFLARVYLNLEDWTNAARKATTVIENPDYVWVNNPELEFLRQSTATIWSLHPGTAGLNTKDASTFIFSSAPPSKPSLSETFVGAFETGDLRRTYWVRAITKAPRIWYHSYKYKRTLGTPTSEEYTILFRLAEQYLIRAEAFAHLNNIVGAQSDVNKIRTRAGLIPTTVDTEEDLLQVIAKERRFEFFTEQGHRWFDLKRTGKASEILGPIKSNWLQTQLILPIPQTELLLNRNLLPQNPGY